MASGDRKAAERAALRALETLYKSLPPIVCKRKCQECCGPIHMNPVEFRRIERRPDVRAKTRNVVASKDEIGLIHLNEMRCPFLSAAGNCTVYADRPMICRLWGLVESMPCPHGCVPEGGFLSDEEGLRLLTEANNAGGGQFVDPNLPTAFVRERKERGEPVHLFAAKPLLNVVRPTRQLKSDC